MDRSDFKVIKGGIPDDAFDRDDDQGTAGGSASGSDSKSIPGRGSDSASGSDSKSIPGRESGSASGSDSKSTPGRGSDSASETDNEDILGSGTGRDHDPGTPGDRAFRKTPAPEILHIKPEFISGWVTDTRLMGVIAMRVHWRFSVPSDFPVSDYAFPEKEDDDHPLMRGVDLGSESGGRKTSTQEAAPGPDGGSGDGKEPLASLDAYQFFYFDSIDTGFERFEQVIGNDRKAISSCEASFAGGLGGKNIDITKAEAIYLFDHYASFNKKRGIPMPQGETDYGFMGAVPVDLTAEEKKALFRKMCTSPLTLNERINYFMMQVCNLDEECIDFLSSGNLGKNCASNTDVTTLYKNDIKELNAESCFTESVVETESGYEIWKSRIGLEKGIVTSYERTSCLEISDTEAFLALSHSEFVMVYKLAEGSPEFNEESTPLTRHSQIVDDEDGISYMLFRPNNKHVDTDKYRLYDDIFGVYHLTSTGQLICSANTKHDMAMLELDLVFSPVYQSMELTGNYEFNEPVMAQFLSSGYDDFDAFMEEITTDG